MRPDVGTQAQFKKTKPPKTYLFDSSLSPSLDWDGQNPAREQGEAAIREVLEAKSLEQAKFAATKLKALGKPFLNWAGKAERLSFDVPTLPLFIHERHSTKAIIETLKGHRSDKQMEFDEFFSDPRHSITDQVLKAYEHRDQWVNRMILGDSLVVMSSLLHYEGLGGQVQTIYMDPPYGVKFGSNFQPFVRNRDVSHNDDEDMTREPEMVQAYRDTWELGLHSYLTYLRDRLLLARDLLTSSGSIFVQISDQNLHHVREVMDEVFGSDNFCGVIAFSKTVGQSTLLMPSVLDFILWYGKSKKQTKYRKLFTDKETGGPGATGYTLIESPDGRSFRSMTKEEIEGSSVIPDGWKIFDATPLVSQGFVEGLASEYKFNGETYRPPANRHWTTTREGMDRLAAVNRLVVVGRTLQYKRYLADYPVAELGNIWMGLGERGFVGEKLYVVQTAAKAIERCVVMTTDPGDLVLDPTCGSGTTAYVAEQWGRRWITIDTSRVPLALARQRLLTATFPWYELKDDTRGPAGGFVYKRKQNKKGEEIGGIVPHVTLKSIANNELSEEEVLVDRPEDVGKVVRISGPFAVEATIPAPISSEDTGDDGVQSQQAESHGSFVDRMLEVLRKSPVLQLGGKKTVTLKNIRLPAKTLSLSAEALVSNGEDKPVAMLFGPENGAISESLVYQAAKEAAAKNYTCLYVIGFAIQPNARELVEKCDKAVGIPAVYIQATLDLMMGDLLKHMRSSQIFSVCGLPEIKIQTKKEGKDVRYQVELLGLDVFDPVTMEVDHRRGDDVPIWLLDTDYNDLCFHANQVFFPRTGAWDNLKRALKTDYEEGVWDHLAGTVSAPFAVGQNKKIAVKVIDDRGNELMVVKEF